MLRYLPPIVLFLIVLVTIVAFSSGLTINWQTKELHQLGGIRLIYTPKDATVTIEGRVYNGGSPYLSTTIKAGSYPIQIAKTDYRTYSRNLEVEAGNVAEVSSAILFKSDLTPVAVTDQAELDAVKKLREKQPAANQFGQLDINGTELNLDGLFITRFSQNINQALWFHDENHLLLQVGTDVIVSEVDGPDRVTVYQAKSVDKLELLPDQADRILYIVLPSGTEKIVLR